MPNSTQTVNSFLFIFVYNKNFIYIYQSRTFESEPRLTKELCLQEKRQIEFQVGDCVMLKVSPWKGNVYGLRIVENSTPISMDRSTSWVVGLQAYKLELLLEMVGIHATFNVCCMQKCVTEQEISGGSRNFYSWGHT